MSQVASTPSVGGTAGTKAGVVVSQHELTPTEPSQGSTEDGSPGCVQLSMELTKRDNLAVFRMFEDLNMLNLFTLQAELTKLRFDFIELASKGKGGLDPWAIIESDERYSVDFSKLYDLNAGKELQERHLVIRGKLKEYNTTLLEVAQVRNLPRPGQAQLKLLRERMKDDPKKKGAKFQDLAKTAWHEYFDDDLISLQTSPSGFTTAVVDYIDWRTSWLAWRWNKSVKPHLPRTCQDTKTEESSGHGLTKCDQLRRASFVSRLFMALFGGIALIGPTLIMALHSSLHTSLITTSAATVLFGLALAFGATDSSGQDVLAATAAYCAVLIVFVGTSLSVKAS